MNKKSIALSAIAAGFFITGCASTTQPAGPGMIVHYGNSRTGILLLVEEVVTSTGTRFISPGALGPTPDPLRNGKTMGAVPDQRALPEWVEFTWREYPKPDRERTREEYLGQPLTTERVQVRSRIPQTVVDEIVRSKKNPARDKDKDLSLWIYFMFTDSGTKLHWREKNGAWDVIRSGGDAFN